MADTNPHNIADKTIVSLTALQRYHHQLLEALGLVHDTAAYKYNGTREDFPEGVTTIAGAIDKIYDLAKSGGVTFNAGYNEDATHDDVAFTPDNVNAGNLYYINAQIGDDIVNIKLDASKFVKDSVLESVILLNVEVDSTTTTYKVNGKVATLDDKAGTLTVNDTDNKTKIYHVDGSEVDSLEQGTYFYYTWKVDNGEASAEDAGDEIEYYQFTCISLKDVYGDIKGDDTYITYDEEEAKIKANTAEVKYVQGEGETIEYKFLYDSSNGVITLTNTEDQTDVITIPWDGVWDEDDDTKAKLEGEGFTNIEFTETGEGTVEKAIPGDGEWKAQVKDADGNYTDATDDALATTNNVKEVAQTLQDQIDTLAQGTLTPGEITLSDEITKSNIDVTNNKININIAVASETDINALFQKCVDGATSIAATSTVNGGEPITTPGEYTINVGEQPEGATTDITWTKA